MIFRIDDVSPNTRLDELKSIVSEITILHGKHEIILGVNIIAKNTVDGSVYPGVPFKDKNLKFFYGVDQLMHLNTLHSFGFSKIASHGLLHSDHSRLSKDAQEMSIITSCSILKTRTFIPPFNRYNDITEDICAKNNIDLLKPSDGWRSLDYEALEKDNFDVKHKYWYLHPWRWTVEKFKEKVSSKVNGFFQADTSSVTEKV